MDKTQSEEKNRRPLAVRDLNFTKRIAVWLSQKQITPNQISLMSIAFALLGCAIFGRISLLSCPALAHSGGLIDSSAFTV